MTEQRGNILIGILIGVFITVVLLGIYYLGTQKVLNPQIPQTINSSNTPPQSTNSNIPSDPDSGWKTYSSSVEKASFRYPNDWILTSPQPQTQPGADTLSIQSPSGQVKISWNSAISGLGGGGCDISASVGNSNACPLFTVIDKASLTGASGLYVVSATTTYDNKTFQPWLAVQDDKGILTTQQGSGYITFQGKHSGEGSQYGNMAAIFGTSGIYAQGPQLDQADATVYFAKPEVQQAKQILLSLTYK